MPSKKREGREKNTNVRAHSRECAITRSVRKFVFRCVCDEGFGGWGQVDSMEG